MLWASQKSSAKPPAQQRVQSSISPQLMLQCCTPLDSICYFSMLFPCFPHKIIHNLEGLPNGQSDSITPPPKEEFNFSLISYPNLSATTFWLRRNSPGAKCLPWNGAPCAAPVPAGVSEAHAPQWNMTGSLQRKPSWRPILHWIMITGAFQ